MPEPRIKVESDFDGYFEHRVRAVLSKVLNCPWEEIYISAGPWRLYGMSASHRGKVLYLDFYSALRTGFGSLEDEEIQQVLEGKTGE